MGGSKGINTGNRDRAAAAALLYLRFSFSFAIVGNQNADAGVYQSQFSIFLRRLSMQDSKCGRLPFAVSLFPSPPFDAG